MQNLDKKPYFSDYDRKNNTLLVLTKPKYAVQNRELIELQRNILQQTSDHGNHFFKFGSPMSGVQMSFVDVPYVKLSNASTIDFLQSYKNVKLVGRTSGVEATLLTAIGKENDDPATLYITYTKTGGNTSSTSKGKVLEFDDTDGDGYTKFLNGELLDAYVDNVRINDNDSAKDLLMVRCPDCGIGDDGDSNEITGIGVLYQFSGGVFWVGDFTAIAEAGTIIVSKYSKDLNYHVGLTVREHIVSGDTDETLFDNALGYANFSAKGADRLRYELTLSKKTLDYGGTDDFIVLSTVENGVTVYLNNQHEYNELANTLAQRTYDESGDYTVEPFTITDIINHKKENENDTNGFLLEKDGGLEDKFISIVSSGLAYVKGYRVNKIASSYVEFDKAREIGSLKSQYIDVGDWSSIRVEPLNTFDVIDNNRKPKIGYAELFDGVASSNAPTGTVVGRCYITSTTTVNQSTHEQKVFITGLEFETNKTLSDVKSISVSGDYPYIANVIDNSYIAGANNGLVYRLPTNKVTSIRDADDGSTSNTTITVKKSFNATLDATGKTSISMFSNEVPSRYNLISWSVGENDGGIYKPLELRSDSVTTSSSTINIDLGASNANKDIVISCPVIITGSTEKIKTLNTTTVQYIAPIGTTEIPINSYDCYSLVSVTAIVGGEIKDFTDNWTLDNRTTSTHYRNGVLKLKSSDLANDDSITFDITYKHFTHSGSGEYFSADSYKSIINQPNSGFTYDDIPKYTLDNGDEVSLSDVVDFRTFLDESSGNSQASTVIIPNTYITTDVSFYNNRIDLLCIDSDGKFVVVKGVPAQNPKIPNTPSNAMLIYHISVGAYTSDLENEVAVRFIENRRYTMRDIGRIEKRVDNAEYYISLNQLERNVADYDVTDSSGNTRFKNGFVVDTFKDFNTSKVNSKDYQCSIDLNAGVLRPSNKTSNVELDLDTVNSSNFVNNNGIITADYTEVEFVKQPYATKSISVQPYMQVAQNGALKITPNIDVWRDNETQPRNIIDIDTGVTQLANALNRTGALGTVWGNWQTERWSTRNTSVSNSFMGTTTTTTTRNFTRSERSGTDFDFRETRNQQSMGTAVTSVNLIPYMRSRFIRYELSGMRANTRLYAFFDGVNITKYLFGARNGILTDDKGEFSGWLMIPNNNELKFTVGEKTLRFTNHPTNSTDQDELTTFAEAKYYSNGIKTTDRETIISTRGIEIIERPVSQGTSTITTSVNRTTVLRNRDPVAQSIIIDRDTFITSVDLYFQTQPFNNENVEVSIVSMDNGLPTDVEIPLSKAIVKASDIQTSDDASSATKFTFDAPVMLKSGQHYAIMVYSESLDCRIFISKMGGTDFTSGNVVNTQPYLGSFFASQNKVTWDSRQNEDIKLTVYRAKFNKGEILLNFDGITNTDIQQCTGNPISTKKDENIISLKCISHGLSDGDLVDISFNTKDTYYPAKCMNGYPIAGSEIIMGDSMGVISDVKYKSSNGGVYDVLVSFSELYGTFPVDTYVTGSNHRSIRKEWLPKGVTVDAFTTMSDGYQIKFTNAVGAYDLNGYNTNDFIGKSVLNVVSEDEFTILMSKNANETGSIGGEFVYVKTNNHFGAFMFDCNVIDFGEASSWKLDGYTGRTIGGDQQPLRKAKSVDFNLGETNEVEVPYLYANEKTQTNSLAGNPSISVTGKYKCDSDWVSPVIDYATAKCVVIANRVNNDKTNNIASYVTQPIKLQTPAAKLSMFVDANTIDGSSFVAEYRVKKVGQSESIDNLQWNEFDGRGYVQSLNENAFIEYSSEFETDLTNAFIEFQFRLKMYANNSARPPKFRGLRILATT